MNILVLKKLLFILGLTTLAPFMGLSSKPSPQEIEPAMVLQDVRSENELVTLESKFQQSPDFDTSKVDQLIKVRMIEEGSVAPFKRNIEATLLLWDAGLRDPNVFMATLLKDSQIDQTVIVHLYGPEVSSLLNEMQSQAEPQMSDSAKMILMAFEEVDQHKEPHF